MQPSHATTLGQTQQGPTVANQSNDTPSYSGTGTYGSRFVYQPQSKKIILCAEQEYTTSSTPQFLITLLHIATLSTSFWVMHYRHWKKDKTLIQNESGETYTFKQYWSDKSNKFDWETKQWETGDFMLNPRFRKPYVDEVYSKYEQGDIDTQTLLDYLLHLNQPKECIFTDQADFRYSHSYITRKKYNMISEKISEHFTNLRATGVNTFKF